MSGSEKLPEYQQKPNSEHLVFIAILYKLSDSLDILSGFFSFSLFFLLSLNACVKIENETEPAIEKILLTLRYKFEIIIPGRFVMSVKKNSG